MNKLVAMRIADSKEGLDRIASAVKQAANRRQVAVLLADDLRNLYQVSTAIGSLEALISQAKRLAGLQGVPADLQKQINERTTQAESGLNELKTRIEILQDQAAKLTLSSFNEDQIKYHESLTNEMVVTKARDLDDVPLGKHPDGTPEAPFELLARISGIQPLWAEHIEAVAGVVLRDDRFDLGLSKFCDQVVDLCRKPPFGLKKTLNVLGRDHAILKDVDWAIFLRFPAWTVWALPLIANEFWRAASRELPLSKGLALRLDGFHQWRETWKNPVMQDCLAEAFGTYVIGPAYAFASVLLILDVNSPSDQCRANAIFATIKWLINKGSKSYDFATGLEQCWHDASPPVSPDPPCSTLLASTTIAAYATTVTDFLRDEMAYKESVWDAVGSQLTDLLTADQDEPGWLARLTAATWEPGTDIRHVLHAGWTVRWGRSNQDQDKVAVDRLSKRMEVLCDVVGRLKQPLIGTEDAA